LKVTWNLALKNRNLLFIHYDMTSASCGTTKLSNKCTIE